MENIDSNELFVKAEELRKSGQQAKAAELFREYWSREKSEDIAWRLISCLRHIPAREEAWQTLYEANECIPDSHLLRTQHQWMLYDFDLADAKNRKNHEKTLEICDQLIAMNPDSMLLQLVVFAATDACKALNLGEKTLQFLAHLDKTTLDKTPREFNGSKILSWRERWYFACINALFDLGNYAECRDTALEAYKDFPAKIEYARKAALCLAETGNETQAAEELERLIRGRRVPWYMYSDLAKILFECGNIEKAWQNACSGAEASGELKTKVNLFYLMARILMAMGNRDAAALHVSLAAKARSEQGWAIPEEISEFIRKFNLVSENSDSSTLLRSCRRYWHATAPADATAKPADKPNGRYRGRLLLKTPDTPFGFIHAENLAENVYVKTHDIPAELRFDGAMLAFSLQTSFDAKKNRESIKAANIAAA